MIAAGAGNNYVSPLCAYPAIVEGVLCVGATDPNDLKASYGTFPNKPQADGTFGPSIVAPGGGDVTCADPILSTWLRSGPSTCRAESGYRFLSGTSAASPHAAGVAALVYERLGGERSATNAEAVIDAIISSVDDLGTPGYDPLYGYGRLNAVRAVQAITVAPTIRTALALTDDSAESGQYSDEATFRAVLIDENNAPVSDAELVFELVGETETLEWRALTDTDGLASVTRRLTSSPGTYALTVRYAGVEGAFEPSNDETGFVLTPEDTITTLTVTGKGKQRMMTATLSEDDGALADREIVFYANGVEIARGRTDGDGALTLAPPNGYKGDHFTFEARYPGELNYNGSSEIDET